MRPNTGDRNRGTILYLALLFVAVINMLALAYVKCIPVEANSFLRSQRALVAHYVAEAGITDSMAWITFELLNGREPTPSGPVTRTGTHDGWTWRVTITPDADSPPGGTASLRFYEVMSEAISPNSSAPARRIRATMGEETFARYTNYTDEFGWVYYNLISGGPFIQGHVHTNTFFRMLPSDAVYTSTSGPTFQGRVTSAQTASAPWQRDGVDYQDMDQAPYDATGAPIGDRYERLYSGGQAGLNTGTSRIEMPNTAMGLAVRAWGEDTPRPTADGVHINVVGEVKGGVYVVGDIKSLVLEDLGGVSKYTIKQEFTPGVEQTSVVIEAHEGSYDLEGQSVPPGHTGIKRHDGGINVFTGLPNGVIHSTGSILGLRGVNRGPRLISADLESNKKIVISGDITRGDTPPGSVPNGSRDVMGLVCYQIEISRDVPRDSGDPLYLYLSYLAGKEESYPLGGFKVIDYDDNTLGRGSYYHYGSAGAGRTYPTGMGSTTGFGFRQYFDQHLINNPPPFFPTTGKLPIRSWREEDANL